MDKQLLAGKKAVVVGASRGIGEAIAELYAEEGAEIVITGRRIETLAMVQNKIFAQGGTAHIFAGDVGAENFPEELRSFAVEKIGRIDLLVISAGTICRDKTLDMKRSDWEKVMTVDVTGPMFIAQACIPEMLRIGGGKIIFISSTAGKAVNMGASPSYGAAKAGLLYVTRHLATEFSHQNILVNAICPGPTETEIIKTWTPERIKEVNDNLPLGHMGKPKDIAYAALFLGSDMSNYMTGESIMVNGGRFME
jgi:3-oxoacyl-[acyl-carrier protein] reductase